MALISIYDIHTVIRKHRRENQDKPPIVTSALEDLQEDIEDLIEWDGNTTDDGYQCVNCRGYFDLPDDYFNGYCPNRSKKFLPDAAQEVFYCAECAHLLLESFSDQATSSWYNSFHTRQDDFEKEVEKEDTEESVWAFDRRSIQYALLGVTFSLWCLPYVGYRLAELFGRDLDDSLDLPIMIGEGGADR